MSSVELEQTNDFRQFLQNELIRRTRSNPKYSMRAFARFLEIQPDYLSKLLLGRRQLTRRTILRLGLRLGMAPQDLDKFESNGVANQQEQMAVYRSLLSDQFHVISDWYHFAMLELVHVKGFKPEPKWIARTLGITVTEVHAAIERLQRLDFLEISPSGKWKILDSGKTTTIGHELTSVALRKMQRQILEKAMESLENISPDLRDQSSMTMAIDTSRIGEAKKRILKFRRQLSEFLESSEKRDQVYQISISLFPLSQINREKK